jgi:putative nucleotidyltransferase with HDIG domain
MISGRLALTTQDTLIDALRRDLDIGSLVLPTLPEIALRVQEVVEDPAASINDIANILRADISLSARILQLANSPFLRAREPITEIRLAVNRLGLDSIQFLSAGLAAEQMFQSARKEFNDCLKRIWAHSLQVASTAHMLAVQHTRLHGEQAFLAGLVHDIGSLPIIKYAEQHEFSIDDVAGAIEQYHTELGAMILESWHFPSEIVKVAKEHEDLDRNPDGPVDYVDVVQVANIQSHLGSEHPLGQSNIAAIAAFARLGLNLALDKEALAIATQFHSSLDNSG